MAVLHGAQGTKGSAPGNACSGCHPFLASLFLCIISTLPSEGTPERSQLLCKAQQTGKLLLPLCLASAPLLFL